MCFHILLATTASNGVWAYFARSDLAGKVIVLVLIALSFVAWTIMIGKYLDLSQKRASNVLLEKHLSSCSTVLEARGRTFTRSPYAHLMAAAFEAYQQERSQTVVPSTHHSIRMAPVENALQRAVAAQCVAYESKMMPLGSIVTGAPFLGLLGTVWGVMDAFGAMGEQTNVTLQALAPGVSGALLTTVAGLLVALPAVFGYNYLLTRIRVLSTELENFASVIADRLERELETR